MSERETLESGLQNIYLHHSIFPSVLTKLPCYTHSNLVGGNGAGKTTMLSLIPIFYGVEPNQMVSKDSDKLNFVGYYLPKSKSMLVFEYRRMGKMCCSVIYRNGQNVEYRFVEGKADDVLFSDELLNSLNDYPDTNQWLMNAVSSITFVTRQIKTSKEYRAVIQNSKRVLREKRKRNDSLLSIASAFSLCDPRYEMKHIEAISSVLMKEGHLLKRLKTMIVDAFLVDQIEMSSSPYHKQDGDYIDNLRSLIELDKNNKDFEALLEKYDALKSLWSKIVLYRRLVRERLQAVSEELMSVRDDFEKKKGERDRVLSEFDKDIGSLSLAYSQMDGELTAVGRQIESLYAEKDVWDGDRDIAHKLSEFERRDNLRDVAVQAEEYYTDLVESVTEERESHEAKINTVKLSHINKREKLDAQKNALREKVYTLSLNTSQTVQSRNDAARKEIENYRMSREEESESLRAKRESLNLALQALSTFTSDEMQRLERFQLDIDGITEKMEIVDEKTLALNGEKEALELSIAEKKTHRNKLSTKLDQLITRREEILRQIEPDDKELRAFLNKQMPGWHLTLGKVIRPELLSMKHLSPSIEEGENSLFGVAIDLDGVELPESSQTIEFLQQRLSDIEKEIYNVEKELVELSKFIESKESDIVGVKSKISALSREKEALITTRNQLKLTAKTEKEAIAQAKLEERARVKARIATTNEMFETFNQATRESIKALQDAHDEAIREYKSSQSIVKSELEESVEKTDEMIGQSKNDESSQIGELRAAFKAVLDNKGISEKAENDARRRRDDAKKRYEAALGYREDVQAYNSWLKNMWSELPALEERETDLKKKSLSAHNKVNEEKGNRQAFESESSHALHALNSNRERLESHESALHHISASLLADETGIPLGYPEAESISDDFTIDMLVSQSSEALIAMKATMSKIRTVVRKVDAILVNTEQRNKVNEFWGNIKREILERGVEEHSDAYQLECAKGINTLVYDIIPDIRRLTVEHIRTIGEGYVRFYQTLGGLSRKVKSTSGVLGKEINTKNNFPNIQNVTIELVSKVEEYAIWRELSSFNREWDRWVEDDRYALPSETFLVAFQNAIDGMKAGGIEGLNSANSLNKIDPLVDIKVSLMENGRLAHINNSDDLRGVSSKGLSRLATIIVFSGATRYLCPDPMVNIHWPLDELGELDHSNIGYLFEFMEGQNITLFCAKPNPDEVTRKYFPIKCKVSRTKGIIRYRPATAKRRNVLLGETE